MLYMYVNFVIIMNSLFKLFEILAWSGGFDAKKKIMIKKKDNKEIKNEKITDRLSD